MNLTREQQELLRAAVRTYQDGCTSPFLCVQGPTSGVLVYENGLRVEIGATTADFERLAKEGLIELGHVANGALRGRPTDAGCRLVGTEFGRRCEAPPPTRVIGEFIETMSGDPAAGAPAPAGYDEHDRAAPDEAAPDEAAPDEAAPEHDVEDEPVVDADCLRVQLEALADQLTDALSATLRGESLRRAIGEVSTLQALVDSVHPDTTAAAPGARRVAERILEALDACEDAPADLARALAAAEALVILGGYAATCFRMLERPDDAAA
ncbi:MAG: hypothetical protein ACYTG1_04215 [Planctomycetota bacterium]|jgi:hypothetical protein